MKRLSGRRGFLRRPNGAAPSGERARGARRGRVRPGGVDSAQRGRAGTDGDVPGGRPGAARRTTPGMPGRLPGGREKPRSHADKRSPKRTVEELSETHFVCPAVKLKHPEVAGLVGVLAFSNAAPRSSAYGAA